MNVPTSAAASAARYSLADLFRFMTVVAVLLGFAPLTGVPAAVLLAAMALALVSRQGLCVVFLYLASATGRMAFESCRGPLWSLQ